MINHSVRSWVLKCLSYCRPDPAYLPNIAMFLWFSPMGALFIALVENTVLELPLGVGRHKTGF